MKDKPKMSNSVVHTAHRKWDPASKGITNPSFSDKTNGKIDALDETTRYNNNIPLNDSGSDLSRPENNPVVEFNSTGLDTLPGCPMPKHDGALPKHVNLVPKHVDPMSEHIDAVPKHVTLKPEHVNSKPKHVDTNSSNVFKRFFSWKSKKKNSIVAENINTTISDNDDTITDIHNKTDTSSVKSGKGSQEPNDVFWDTAPLTEQKTEVNRSLKCNSSKGAHKGLIGLLTPVLPGLPTDEMEDTLHDTYENFKSKNYDLELAAAHIDDALKGRGAYGRARAVFKSKWTKRCFEIYDNPWFNRWMYVIILLHSLLAFWEPCQDTVTPGGVHPVVIALNALCVLMYGIDITLHLIYFSWKKFWTLEETKWMRIEFVFVCMFFVDFLMLVIQAIVGKRLAQPFRCLRAATINCKAKNVGHIFDACLSIILKLGKVFFIIFLFIFIFAAIGVHIYMDEYHYIGCEDRSSNNFTLVCEEDYDNVYTGAYDHILIGALRLFALLSTENYPELMIPAYSVNNANFFYFGIFLYFGVFILTTVLLAIVVESYWDVSKKYIKKERKRERTELAKAWNLLDPLGDGIIATTEPKFFALFRMVKPKLRDCDVKEILDYIDDDGDGGIATIEWITRLTDALNYEFEKPIASFKITSPKWLAVLCNSIRSVVKTGTFERIVLVLIIAHSILFCVHWHNMTETQMYIIQGMKTGIVGLFFFETVLRILGLWKELLQFEEMMDITFTMIALISNILWYFYSGFTNFEGFEIHTYRGACTVVSCLSVFCRLMFNSRHTRKALHVFIKIYPVMFDLIMLVIIIIYFYGILGLEFFHGYEPVRTYESGHYEYQCGLGFDTLSCSFLAVFQVVTTSNWHEIMNAAIVSTSYWASLYFVTCYLIIDMVVMSLFVAITIEAFKHMITEEDTDGDAGLVDPLATQDENDEDTDKQRTIVKSAKQLLDEVFAPSRNPSGSLTNLNSPSLNKHHSKVQQQIPSSDTEEDYTGLTAHERKQRILKKKMKKRKRQTGVKIKVISAFRKTKDSEIDLHVGDEVKLIEKQGRMWKGTTRDKTGWFPASNVIEIVRGANKSRQKAVEVTPEPTGHSIIESSPPKPAWSSLPVQPKIPLNDNLNIQSEVPMKAESALAPQGLSAPNRGLYRQSTNINMSKRNAIKGNHGDWRRKILGDMTVMNQEEMLELNRIVRAEMKESKKGGGALARRLNPKLVNLVDEIKEEQEEQAAPTVHVPQINVETAESQEDQTDNQKHEVEDSGSYLGVQTPKLPKSKKKKETNGEMPDWAKRFLTSHDLEAKEGKQENTIPDASTSEDDLTELARKDDDSGSMDVNLNSDTNVSTLTMPDSTRESIRSTREERENKDSKTKRSRALLNKLKR
ncbi:unnamed protein product [Owenia fusiformis]|uniref:Uncharacterized protein n=2 Tax=Owenia fusiformis TaxID=6347 RepID=A0A8J1UJR9_OWEFU|nr:unnamed protein product [Owenia fusiformis]